VPSIISIAVIIPAAVIAAAVFAAFVLTRRRNIKKQEVEQLQQQRPDEVELDPNNGVAEAPNTARKTELDSSRTMSELPVSREVYELRWIMPSELGDSTLTNRLSANNS
jgi:hypothetical protein